MSQISQVQKLIQRDTSPIHFLTAKDMSGRDCYYFIMSPIEKIDRMLKQATDDGIDLTEFDIVARGFGTEPSEAVTQLMKKYYHYDPSLSKRQTESA